MAVGAPQVDVGHVIIDKFPLFVLGFIFMFLINLTGVFLPKGVSANDLWKGQYFDNNLRAERLLKDKDIDAALRLTYEPCIVAGAQGVSSIDKQTFAKMMATGVSHARILVWSAVAPVRNGEA
jgi:hypothetical protein